jgi:hypothetical protein
MNTENWTFRLGDRVTKTKGSSWTGRVVGFYSTTLTPEGYAVESENERGSVQIYPRPALRAREGEGEPVAWIPIETAPKDGTTIDVWRDGHRYTVYWGLPPHCCGEMGQYCDSDWHGLKEPGWICSTFGEFVGGEHHPFTHWMPLPDAPEQSND